MLSLVYVWSNHLILIVRLLKAWFHALIAMNSFPSEIVFSFAETGLESHKVGCLSISNSFLESCYPFGFLDHVLQDKAHLIVLYASDI